MSIAEFAKLAISKNANCGEFNYLSLEFSGKRPIVKYECKKHGLIRQVATVHLNGHLCPQCGIDKRASSHTYSYEVFIDNCNKKFNNQFDYIIEDRASFCAAKTVIKVKCKKCNSEKTIVARNHYNSKRGSCTTCQYKSNGEKSSYTLQEIQSAADINFPENNFVIKPESFISGSESCSVACPAHGEYICNKAANFLLGHGGCPKCKKSTNLERFFISILDEFNIEYSKNDRRAIKPQELDFFIPKSGIGIEACGLYWHSEAVVSNNYHLIKYNNCIQNNIRLFQFFEDEIINSPKIVKSMVLNALGKSNKIHARKCETKILSSKDKSEFLESNHIQGNCSDSVAIGLFYNGVLVSCMTFGTGRIALGHKAQNNTWELVRYCNLLNHTVVGGASKLLSFFENHYAPKQIFTFCNLRYGTGTLYSKLGFELSNKTKPNYYYYKSGKGQRRYNRFKFRKSELSKLLNTFDLTLTEKENMIRAGYLRLYDCGNLKFIKKYVK